MANATAPKVHYIRFVDEGLLLDGKVWREGSYCASSDPAAGLTAAQQRKRLGRQFYESMTKDEYDRGLHGRTVATAPKPKKAKPAAKAIPAGVSIEGASSTSHSPATKVVAPEAEAVIPDAPDEPIEDYALLEIAELLSHVASMGDEGATIVLSYERATLNRPEVIKALETGELPE